MKKVKKTEPDLAQQLKDAREDWYRSNRMIHHLVRELNHATALIESREQELKSLRDEIKRRWNVKL